MASLNSGGKGFIGNMKDMSAATQSALDPLQKFVIALAGIVATAAVVYAGVKSLASSFYAGSLSAGEFAIKAGLVVTALGLIGTAMYMALGPLGLVLIAITALVAGSIAFANATAEHDRAVASAAIFSPNGGIPVQAIADNFLELTDRVNQNSEAILANQSEMGALAGSIGLATTQVHNLSAANIQTAEEAAYVLPELAKQYETLSSDIIRNIELAGETILTALMVGPQEALDANNTTLPEIGALITQTTTGMSEDMIALQNSFRDTYETWQSNPSPELEAQLQGLAKEMLAAGGVSLDMSSDYSAALAEMVPVDFSSLVADGDAELAKERLTGLVNSISEGGAEAQANLAEAQVLISESLDTITAGMSPEQAQLTRDVMASMFELESGKILEQQSQAMSLIREGFASEVDKFAEAVDPNWTDELFASMFDVSVQAETTSRVNRMFSDVFDAIDTAQATTSSSQGIITGLADGLRSGDTAAVKSAAKQLGSDATDAVAEGAETHSPSTATIRVGEGIIQGLVNGISSTSGQSETAAKTAADSVISAFKSVLSTDKMTPVGKTLIDGIAQGITQNQSAVVAAASQMAAAVNRQLTTDLSTTKTSPYGKDAVTGIQQGIQRNQTLVVNAAKTLSTGTLQAFQQYLNQTSGHKYGADVTQGIANGISSTTYAAVNAMNSVGSQLSLALANIISNLQRQAAASPINIQMTTTHTVNTVGGSSVRGYATGGVVTSGELFMARENGMPELVGGFGGKTGVMNNDQIVSAVSAGVYEAVSAAMAGQNDDGQPIVIQLDGRTLYESNIKTGKKYGYGGFVNTAATLG